MHYRLRKLGLLQDLLVVLNLACVSLPVRAVTCESTHTVASAEGCWSTDSKIIQAQLLPVGLDCSVIFASDYCSMIETEQNVLGEDFMALNSGISCDDIIPGQTVCVAAPSPTLTQVTTSAASTSLASSTTSTIITPTPTHVACAWNVPVSEGDTCYNLATANGLQLAQFMALNEGLNCTGLQAGDIVCIEVACSQVYKVQPGDWCAKIESDWSLAANQLASLNPGLSCNELAPEQILCVEPAQIVNNTITGALPPLDPFPALSPGEEVPQSPILAFASVDGNARSTFYGEMIFQGDAQHLAGFTHNDLNGDGKLDHDELEKMMSVDPTVLRGISDVNSTLTADNLVAEMLKSADLNGDGSIDQDEFLYAIRQVQNATNTVTELAADRTTLGQHRKRAIPFIIAGIAALIGLIVADVTLFFQVLADSELLRGNNLLSYLDLTFWDGSGSPPSCAAYLYWSTNCGAIGSGWAKSCSNGGQRVFGSSCVTHFNSGSAGCGILGCKSLCYDFNLDNCSCDALKYAAVRNTQCTDTPRSISTERGVSACRSKCGNTNGCVGFSVSPGSSDRTLTCKVFTTLFSTSSNSDYTLFKLIGAPVGSGGNVQCPPIESPDFTPWPASVMADDIDLGDKISDAYNPFSSLKRAPPSVDRRNDPKFSTTVKNQSASRCGLCAPFSFTTTVEGTHKVWKGGYNYVSDLSPVWVGRCKGKQSCDIGSQGGNHGALIQAVGHDYIRAESCIPIGTVDNPQCSAMCTDRTLPYITGSKQWEFRHQDQYARNQFVNEIKEWISTTGPVMSSICVNSGFGDYSDALKRSSSDIIFWSKDPRWGKMTCGTCNHGITVVGYNTYFRAGQTRLYWIIQNSYGSGFGRGGYQFIEHGSAAMWATTWYGVKVNNGIIHDQG